MGCNDCKARELVFEVKMEGAGNMALLSEVGLHLNRKKVLAELADPDRLVIKEAGMADFLDFSLDHMDFSKIHFRVGGNGWAPVSQMGNILKAHWVDEVIQKEQISCFCQPIVSRDKEIYAYEILSRFFKADGTVVYPNEVFAAAKIRGRLYTLDKMCRMAAVRAAGLLQKRAFVNFIPTSIYSPEHCLKSTMAVAGQLGLNPANIIFEVVETEQVADIEHLKRILAYYRERGFQYALDDVGEGYSTVELLEQIKPQYMKLDMKYVQGVANEEEKQKMAYHFLQAATQVGSIPLAEGVEAEQDFEWLKEAGYQLFQGYLFGRPAPVTAVTAPVTGTINGQMPSLSAAGGH